MSLSVTSPNQTPYVPPPGSEHDAAADAARRQKQGEAAQADAVQAARSPPPQGVGVVLDITT